jgi:cytochrome c nitrite reductase small subunit
MRLGRWRASVSLAGLLLAALVGVALGLGSYTFYYGEGGSYLSNDPKACVNCHVMRDVYDGWSASSHHAVATCNDCHVPHDFFGKWASKAHNGFFHSKAFTLQDFHEPIRIKPKNAKVLQANCIRCHQEVTHDVRALGSAGDPSNSCVRCHVQVGHGPAR